MSFFKENAYKKIMSKETELSSKYSIQFENTKKKKIIHDVVCSDQHIHTQT